MANLIRCTRLYPAACCMLQQQQNSHILASLSTGAVVLAQGYFEFSARWHFRSHDSNLPSLETDLLRL